MIRYNSLVSSEWKTKRGVLRKRDSFEYYSGEKGVRNQEPFQGLNLVPGCLSLTGTKPAKAGHIDHKKGGIRDWAVQEITGL
jgi:hypothetical protein